MSTINRIKINISLKGVFGLPGASKDFEKQSKAWRAQIEAIEVLYANSCLEYKKGFRMLRISLGVTPHLLRAVRKNFSEKAKTGLIN